ncbi:MAG TPA: L,D-transpeptidase family protein [Chloroflexota bacterium]|nr:L,D-transpeptidase family protein [Chloroflexota bacterium]
MALGLVRSNRSSVLRPKQWLAGGILAAVAALVLVACSAPGATAAVAPTSAGSAATPPPAPSVAAPAAPPTAPAQPTIAPVATPTALPTSTPRPTPTPVPPPNVQGLTLAGASQTADGGVPLVAAKDQPVLHWTLEADRASAADHLLELADHEQAAPASPPADATAIPASNDSQSLGDLADGSWYVHLWAVNGAGQASAPATVAVQVLRTAPQFSDVLYRTWVTNPSYQTLPINFTLSQVARVSVFILPESSGDPLRTFALGQQKASAPIKVEWDGKDAQGHVVPPGSYRFMVDAVDVAGNQTQAVYNGLSITDKVIKVSLGKQQMIAYAGDTVFATTLVTSGGQALPTPKGQFEILQKSSPFVFHAQFPKGSPYWFPDVTSHEAMLFDQPDADFIHDAPWRSVYGPGTNGPGIPGATYTGSHGCVETPGATMTRLYDWTPLGTPVIVTP